MRKTLPLLFLIALVSVAASTTPPAGDANVAPRIVKLHGGVLDSAVYLIDWSENLRLWSSIAVLPNTPPITDDERPYVDITSYWYGPMWERFVKDTALLPTLPPDGNGVGHGRLYLGSDDQPAVLIFPGARVSRTLKDGGLEILVGHGVPARR